MAVLDIFYNEVLRMRDKKLAEDERVSTAKILVRKVLIGFWSDWRTYSKCVTNNNPEFGYYVLFIHDDKRLLYHIQQFTDVAVEIRAVDILPEEVSDNLLDLAARMRALLIPAQLWSAWEKDNPTSCRNLFDEIIIDAYDMYTDLDNDFNGDT